MPGSVISAISHGEAALCSTGDQRRDFLYIQDVANAIVAILDGGVTGPINVCSGTAMPIALMAEQTAKLMDGQSLLRLGALPSRPNEPALIVGDNSRLTQEVGWVQQFSLAEGLRATISAWSSHDASTQSVDLAKSGAS
jgi:nucleoside-diphosphate-sugar epimerase